jgi:hypothetical protein
MKRCGAGRERRSKVFVLAVLCAFWLPCRAQAPAGGDADAAPPSELDLQSYQRELARMEQASKNSAGIPGLRRSLPDVWRVKNGDQIYSVPTKEISDALREIQNDPKKSTQLKARLKAMTDQADQLARPSASANPRQAEEKLKKILNHAEFQDATGPSGWDQMRARMNRWIIEHLARLFGMMHISRRTGNLIGWAILFAAIVAVFYALYRWLRKSTAAVAFHAELQPSPSDARHWVQEALAAADRGDFREAVHSAYWASVAHLEDIRILPHDRARTPRESLRLLEQHPKEQGILQAITRSFELIWYGYRPASATEWAGTKKDLERMGCL